ncbi:RNA-binding domain-containing protein [Westerdykella ornata]|uniref:RNA-binding domain-containing protein n=1 Tax=Westerdykella ornata TaxID=318751 RepID=A0A6A6J867_WESOR|nr:RNA-binding domain-containing protein [Westerdykella ornata]KAF2272198.1 RNA-binding domain-containing protein [Westerdykella ornata]
MTDPEELDEDLFADLYEGDDTVPTKPSQPAPTAQPEPPAVSSAPPADKPSLTTPTTGDGGENGRQYAQDGAALGESTNAAGTESHAAAPSHEGNNRPYTSVEQDDDYGPINVKEDGKMFIGGLNWETTEQSLRDYFSQFGEVSECTVMRDSTTGRSRGFGFLTFRDPKCVNTVMVKEHFLDGKIIDPKRAIPREEQERTSKIFVGGVSQEATEEDFKNFFKQFGRVIDATLMMDKDTGRPRGFGFVTFEGDAAVEATLKGNLQILGKPIEVKRAQPRGNMREEEDKKFGRGKFGGRHDGGGFDNQQMQNQEAGTNPQGMTPAMMAQYWQRMQQWFRQAQQNFAAQQGGMANPMAMGAMAPQMNPAMMPQMMAAMNPQAGSPLPQGQMNPMMQMQQMQQMQMQQQQQGGGYGDGSSMMGPGGNRPGYNAQEQMAFEQQKYEQQQRQMHQGYGGQGGPTSWEGMYDDIPQPSIPAGPSGRASQIPGHGGRGGGGAGGYNRGRQGSSQPPTQPSNAPLNAPTGPRNAGKPGANYRGGGRHGGGFRHSPYGGGPRH